MRPSDTLNWDDLKLILALADAGYVNRAAEQLRMDPTTIPRRIKRMEQQNGVKLVERIKGGVVLTPIANALVQAARGVETAVNTTLAPHDPEQDISGVVKVSATDFILDLIAPELVALQQSHPELVLDLRPTNDFLSIDRRETDIAIRLTERPHDSLVGRRIGVVQLGVFALPQFAENKPGQPWVSWNLPKGLSEIDRVILSFDPEARIVARVDSMIAHARLAVEGMGRVLIPTAYVRARPYLSSLVQIGEAHAETAWVVTHEELRNVPRINKTMAAIAKGFSVFESD